MEKIIKILNHKVKTDYFIVVFILTIGIATFTILASSRVKQEELKKRLKEVSKQAIESGLSKDSLKKRL